MSHQQPRSIAPIIAGGAFAVAIVTFGLLIYGRSTSTNNTATGSASPSVTPSTTTSSTTGSPSSVSSPPTNASPSPVTSPSSRLDPHPSPSPKPEPTPAPRSSPASSLVTMQQSALVIDPPSNVRDKPNGEILCSLPKQTTISLSGQQGNWYQTDVCGSMGYIHSSQVQLSPATETQPGGVAQVIDPPSNVRTSPNGSILCKISTETTIRISERRGDWYITDTCGEPGYIHKSQLKF